MRATGLVLSVWMMANVLPMEVSAEPTPHRAGAESSVTLIDATGVMRDFEKDVVGDRTVVLNFMFTRCQQFCPPQTFILRQLQDKLGARLGRDVVLASVTLDPEHDTPGVLTSFSRDNQVGQGWYFLTGERDAIEALQSSLGASGHEAVFFIGRNSGRDWQRVEGFPKATALLAEIDREPAGTR